MSNKIIAIKEKVPQTAMLPDGAYQGTWGGNCITVRFQEKTYELTTEEGVRGFGYNVVVLVKDGNATFEQINN